MVSIIKWRSSVPGLTLLDRPTPDERIAGCTGRTLAIGWVPHYKALSSFAARACTWIGTASINTRLIGRALFVGYTLGLTVWRSAKIARDTRVVLLWFLWWCWPFICKRRKLIYSIQNIDRSVLLTDAMTLNPWITRVTRRTYATGNVVGHTAYGIERT